MTDKHGEMPARIWAWKEDHGDVWTGEWSPDKDEDHVPSHAVEMMPVPADMALTCDRQIAQGFPDGSVDMATYFEIEDALDRAEAPIQAENGSYLKLHERIDALTAERAALLTQIAALTVSDDGSDVANGWNGAISRALRILNNPAAH